MSKSIFKSKVFWFNLITIITVVAGSFGYTPDQNVVEAAGNLLLLTAPIVNIVLRYFTTKPVTVG
jgi:hypothetical protein